MGATIDTSIAMSDKRGVLPNGTTAKLARTAPGPRAAAGGTARPAQPGRVAIRLATQEADIQAMIVLGRQMHAEGRFKKFFYDEARLLAAGKAALKHGNPGIILAERDGQLVGMATIVASEQFFTPAKVASLHLLFVRKDARHGRAGVMLLAALRQWAKAAGAVEFNLSTTMGVDILRRMGFRQTGGNYVLEGLG